MENLSIEQVRKLIDIYNWKQKKPEEYKKFLEAYKEITKDVAKATLEGQAELLQEYKNKEEKHEQSTQPQNQTG